MTELKQQTIQTLKQLLEEQLAQYEKACIAAVERSNESEGRNQTRYDTQKIETAYLANAFGKKYEDVSRQYGLLNGFRFDQDNESIKAGHLVKLENYNREKTETVLLLPGKWGIWLEELDIMVLSVLSPLGRELIGRKIGESFQLDLPAGTMQYRIVEIE